jgi:nitroreductase
LVYIVTADDDSDDEHAYDAQKVAHNRSWDDLDLENTFEHRRENGLIRRKSGGRSWDYEDTEFSDPEGIKLDTDDLIDAAVDVYLNPRKSAPTIRDPRQFELTLEDLRRRAGIGRQLVSRRHSKLIEFGAYYKRASDEQVAPRYRSGEPAPGMSRERFLRLLDAAEYLAAHIHEAPVWIVPCLEGGTATRTSGSSIYPAVQNMLLAARALGLGATLTTLHLQFEKEAEAALGLPPNVHSYALLPIGYPMGRFGPVRRVPLADVVYEDRWGQSHRDL